MARNQSALTFCKPSSLPTNELTHRKEVCPIRGELLFSAEGRGLGGEGSGTRCLRGAGFNRFQLKKQQQTSSLPHSKQVCRQKENVAPNDPRRTQKFSSLGSRRPGLKQAVPVGGGRGRWDL